MVHNLRVLVSANSKGRGGYQLIPRFIRQLFKRLCIAWIGLLEMHPRTELLQSRVPIFTPKLSGARASIEMLQQLVTTCAFSIYIVFDLDVAASPYHKLCQDLNYPKGSRDVKPPQFSSSPNVLARGSWC